MATVERQLEQPRLLAGYWCESARPLASLLFVAPMLLIYEGGVLMLGAQATRNGVDDYLRKFLDTIGFGQYFLLPILTTVLLLAWHHTTRHPWKVRGQVLLVMLLEALAFGILLLIVADLQGSLFSSLSVRAKAASGDAGVLIGYFGAGIYEELAFRLMMLPAAIAVLRTAGISRRWSMATAVVITSLLFSAAHYEFFISHGDAFQWYSFTFRFSAGAFFATLFLWRGFGIAVGAHALYDILVVIA